jgi:hypothetical protein
MITAATVRGVALQVDARPVAVGGPRAAIEDAFPFRADLAGRASSVTGAAVVAIGVRVHTPTRTLLVAGVALDLAGTDAADRGTVRYWLTCVAAGLAMVRIRVGVDTDAVASGQSCVASDSALATLASRAPALRGRAAGFAGTAVRRIVVEAEASAVAFVESRWTRGAAPATRTHLVLTTASPARAAVGEVSARVDARTRTFGEALVARHSAFPVVTGRGPVGRAATRRTARPAVQGVVQKLDATPTTLLEALVALHLALAADAAHAAISRRLARHVASSAMRGCGLEVDAFPRAIRLLVRAAVRAYPSGAHFAESATRPAPAAIPDIAIEGDAVARAILRAFVALDAARTALTRRAAIDRTETRVAAFAAIQGIAREVGAGGSTREKVVFTQKLAATFQALGDAVQWRSAGGVTPSAMVRVSTRVRARVAAHRFTLLTASRRAGFTELPGSDTAVRGHVADVAGSAGEASVAGASAEFVGEVARATGARHTGRRQRKRPQAKPAGEPACPKVGFHQTPRKYALQPSPEHPAMAAAGAPSRFARSSTTSTPPATTSAPPTPTRTRAAV